MRHTQLTAEIAALDVHLAALVERINPALLDLTGVGVDVAGQLLITAGGNPENRSRLNRGGDRQANCALYRVTLSRLRWDPRTRAHAEHRTAEGLSKKEIIRCLKRLIAPTRSPNRLPRQLDSP